MADTAIAAETGVERMPSGHRHDGPVLDLHPAFDPPPIPPRTARKAAPAPAPDAVPQSRRRWLLPALAFIVIVGGAMALALFAMTATEEIIGGEDPAAADRIAEARTLVIDDTGDVLRSAAIIEPPDILAAEAAPAAPPPRVEPAPALPERLAATGITTVRVYAGGEVGLVVSGAIANGTGRSAAVPALTLRVLGPDGSVLGNWRAIAARQALAPGASTRFDAEITPFPAAGTTLEVAVGTDPATAIAID